MTPERKAELRRLGDNQHDVERRGPFNHNFSDARPMWNEMLDEIDRLEAENVRLSALCDSRPRTSRADPRRGRIGFFTQSHATFATAICQMRNRL